MSSLRCTLDVSGVDELGIVLKGASIAPVPLGYRRHAVLAAI